MRRHKACEDTETIARRECETLGKVFYTKTDANGSPMTEKMDKASESKKGFVGEFVEFLQTFGVIGLAIAFIIGVAASSLINAFVTDLINPLIGLFLPSGDLGRLNVNATSISGKVSTFSYGAFISSLLNFLIIALVVFAMYKQLKKYGLTKV